MNPLLITGFGTSINVDKRKLIITNRLKDTRLEFYPHKINHDGVIIDGHTGNITFEAMRWLIDISVIQLLEEKKIKKSDFIITENYHTRLGEDVAKLLVEKINSNFNARYNYKNDKQYSYQIILQNNLQHLSNFILEKKKEFDFIIPKMKLNRNDDLELRERILSMTPEERKQLGINKSTLWYIKKNLSEGKTPKIYGKIHAKMSTV